MERQYAVKYVPLFRARGGKKRCTIKVNWNNDNIVAARIMMESYFRVALSVQRMADATKTSVGKIHPIDDKKKMHEKIYRIFFLCASFPCLRFSPKADYFVVILVFNTNFSIRAHSRKRQIEFTLKCKNVLSEPQKKKRRNNGNIVQSKAFSVYFSPRVFNSLRELLIQFISSLLVRWERALSDFVNIAVKLCSRKVNGGRCAKNE